MKPIRILSLFVVIATLISCGGSAGNSLSTGAGLAFDDENPSQALPGSTFSLLVDASAASNQEVNSSVTVRADTNSNFVGVTETSWTQAVTAVGTRTYHVLNCTVSPSAPVGTSLRIHVYRALAGTDQIVEDHTTVFVGRSIVQGTLVSTNVAAAPGQVATSALDLTPVGGFSGSVTLAGLLPGATVTPSTVTLTAGQTAPTRVTLSYAVPADAPFASILNVPFGWESSAGHAFTVLQVQTPSSATPDFAFHLDPGTATLTPGDTQGSITVEIVPQADFTGDVSVAVQFPGQSLSITPPTTNPFTIHVPLGGAVATGSFKIRWNNQLGTPQGDATVTCTSGTHVHTATLHLVAS